MLELVLFVSGVAGGFAAAVWCWPWLRSHAIGAAAEVVKLRARAQALEDAIRRTR